jgi:Fe-S cluster assembly protein SufD
MIGSKQKWKPKQQFNMVAQTPEIFSATISEHYHRLVDSNVFEANTLAPRAAAIDRVNELGLPTMKMEVWKYTLIRKAFKDGQLPFIASGIKATADQLPAGIPSDAALLVYLDGEYQAHLSRLPEQQGLRFSPTAPVNAADIAISKDTGTLQAMHHAFTPAVLDIHVNGMVEKTLCIVHLLSGRPGIFQPTQHIRVEKNAAIHIFEYTTTAGEGATVGNLLTHINVGENASCHYHKLQGISDKQFLIDRTEITLQANARMYHGAFSFGGDIIRNDLNIKIQGQNTEAYLDGLYLLQGNTHVDNATVVDHAVPNCYSNELYKGIISDFATGVFNGKIIVRPDAQKTNAFQSNRNILLSEGANIYSKPQLEIFADDVKCSHGATSSRLDSTETFYMQSRGISKQQAEALLVYAFAAETLKHINDQSIKELIEKKIANKLSINI